MPRLKMEMPENFLDLSIKIPVRITDINYGDHVGNDAIVSIVHEARVQFLQHHNFTELNIEGIGLIMAELQIEFKNESFYKDIIEVKIGVGQLTNVGFELFYHLKTFRNNSEVIIANAKTGMVCYNYEIKKVVAIPKSLTAILSV